MDVDNVTHEFKLIISAIVRFRGLASHFFINLGLTLQSRLVGMTPALQAVV